MDSFIETFHIDWKLMLAQAINFGLVFFAFYYLANKPLSKLIKDRKSEIQTGLEDGKKNAELLKQTEASYQEALAKARAEADSMYKQAKKEATANKIKMIEDAKEEVAQMIESGKKTLEAEKVKMVNEAKKEIVTLVIKSTEKVLGAKVDASYSDRVTKELSNI